MAGWPDVGASEVTSSLQVSKASNGIVDPGENEAMGITTWSMKLGRPLAQFIMHYQNGNQAAVIESSQQVGQVALDVAIQASNSRTFISANQAIVNRMAAGAQMVARGCTAIMQSAVRLPDGSFQFDPNQYEAGMHEVLQGYSVFNG